MDSDGSPTVVLTVTAGAWRDTIDGLDTLAERILQVTLEAAAVDGWLREGEVSLLLANDARIRSLNAAYRQKDRPTNVLSFPGIDLESGRAPNGRPPGMVPLGDVAIAFERAADEAASLGKPLADHFAHLLVHGALHLLGYDHGDETEAAVMEGLEAEILKKLGFAAPYQAADECSEGKAGTMSAAL